MEKSYRRMGRAYGDHFLLSWNKAEQRWGWSSRESEINGFIPTSSPLCIPWWCGWRNTKCIHSRGDRSLRYNIYMTLSIEDLSSLRICCCFLLEVHLFEVVKWTWVSELLFHHLEVLPSFRHQIIMGVHLPRLDHNLHEDGDLVLSPALRTVPGPQQVLHTFVEWMHVWMKWRCSCTRKKHNITLHTCTTLCSVLLKLSPVPSQVPVMAWRCRLRFIYMPGLIVPVSLPPQWGLCKRLR